MKAFLLFFSFVAALFAGNSDSLNVQLADSLLLEGRYQALKTFLEKNPTVKFSNRYRYTIGQIEKIKSLPQERIEAQVQQVKRLKTQFTMLRAGGRATKLYQKFLTEAQNGNLPDALEYYFLANHFRKNHLQSVKTRLRQVLKRASQAFSNGAYERVLQILQNLEFENFKQNYRFTGLIDSLQTLQQNASAQLQKKRQQAWLWQRNEVVDYRLAFVVSGAVRYQAGIEPFNLTVEDMVKNDVRTLQIKKLVPGFAFSFGVGTLVRLTQNLLIEGNFHYARFNYSSEYVNRLIFFNYDVEIYSFQLLGIYRFRNSVGLRTFVGLGLGMVTGLRPESFTLVYGVYDPQRDDYFRESYRIPKRRVSGLQYVGTLGLEYIPSSRAWWGLRPLFSVLYNAEEHNFWGRFGYRVSAQIFTHFQTKKR